MLNKIYKKKDTLFIEVPLTTHRSNPWDEEYRSEMNHVCGLIIHHRGNSDYDEFGFAYVIDMEYKDKSDQYTDLFYEEMEMDVNDFKDFCLKLGIATVEYTDYV